MLDENLKCENPFPEDTMAKEFTCICRTCGEHVPMAGNGPREHLALCRPEATRAIEQEFRPRIRALAGPAEEGMRGAA